MGFILWRYSVDGPVKYVTGWVDGGEAEAVARSMKSKGGVPR
jgi:hypothetical protein